MLRCVLVLGAATVALACDGLDLFSRNTKDCLKQLTQMGGGVDMTTDVHFPNKLYKNISKQNVESQLLFVQENLHHIFQLYCHGNLSHLGWDVTGFLTSLDRQTNCLRLCVSMNQSEHLDVSRYYRRLQNATQRVSGRLRLWKKINHITLIHLHRLNSLVLSIRAATTRGRYGRETAPEPSNPVAPLERIIGRRAGPECTTRRRPTLDH